MYALALLHPIANLSWWRWSIHPSTVIGIAALGALYIWASHRLRQSPTDGQKIFFACGLLLMFATLNGPIHDLSDDYLFSAHMVQHLLLTLAIPPLLLAGTPGWMLRPVLSRRGIKPVAQFFTRATIAFAVFNLTIAFWHLPLFYNAAMAHHSLHIIEHLMFMATAVLMWWPLLSQLPEFPRLAYPGQMLYSFLMSIPMSIVAVYIAYANSVLYPAYATAPRIWGISPMQDQLIGGLIMWIPGGLFFFAIISVIFFRWQQHEGDETVAGAQVTAAQLPASR
jgi:putative membrane protein